MAMKVLDFFLMLAQLKKASDISNFQSFFSDVPTYMLPFLSKTSAVFFFFFFLVGVAFLVP